MPNMFSGIGEKKTLYSHGGEYPICRVSISTTTQCWVAGLSFLVGSWEPWRQTTLASRLPLPKDLQLIGKAFWLLELPLDFSIFQPSTIPGLASFLLAVIVVKHHKCVDKHLKWFAPSLGSGWISASHIMWAGRRLEYPGFHSCRQCDPIKTSKDKGIDGLSYSQFLENMLCLLYRFPGSPVPRKSLFIGPSFPAG